MLPTVICARLVARNSPQSAPQQHINVLTALFQRRHHSTGGSDGNDGFGTGGSSSKRGGYRGRRKRNKMDRFFDMYAHFDPTPAAPPPPTFLSPFSAALIGGGPRTPADKSIGGGAGNGAGKIPARAANAEHQVPATWKAGAQKQTPENYTAVLDQMLAETNPRQIREHLDDYVIGQDAAKQAMSCAIYNHYTRVLHNLNAKQAAMKASFPSKPPTHLLDKSNILMLGPSGSGKTLIAKRIAEILHVPFSTNDATTFTQAGYVGDDVEQCISRLIASANSDVKKAEIGIVFIDEIDKISKRSEAANSGNSRDVAGEGVQQSLLKMLEGTTVYVNDKGGKKSQQQQQEPVPVDTSNILFILSGAFVGIDRVAQHRTKADRSMGFGAKVTTPVSDQESCESPGDFNERDLIQYGLIPEFVGRIPLVVAVNKLSEQELIRILRETKNSLVEQYTRLFQAWNVDLEFTDGALSAIARRVIDRSTGARGLKFVMEDILKAPMYHSPGSRMIKSIRFDESLSPTYFNNDGQQLFRGATTTAARQGREGIFIDDLVAGNAIEAEIKSNRLTAATQLKSGPRPTQLSSPK